MSAGRAAPGRRRVAGWILGAALAWSTVAARATVLLPAEFDDMVAGSSVIVHGRILDVRGQASGDRRTIESLVTLEVEETFKGRPGRVVSFRVPGGQVGRYRRVMVGAPVFAEGDEVVLFLRGSAPVLPMPYGLNQGVFRVVRDGSGRALVGSPDAATGRVVRGDPARTPVPLDVFARRVRTVPEAGR